MIKKVAIIITLTFSAILTGCTSVPMESLENDKIRKNVILKLDMFINDNLTKSIILEGKMSNQFFAQIDGEVKLDITPTIDKDAIKLSMLYYEYDGTEFVLTQKPVIRTYSNQAATIEIGVEDGKVYKIEVTPQTKI